MISHILLPKQGLHSHTFKYLSKSFYSTSPYTVFDRDAKLKQRQRAASDIENSRTVEYLRDEIALKSVERLAFIKRKFPNVLDLGCNSGNFEKVLCDSSNDDRPSESVKGYSFKGDREAVKNNLGVITMLDSCREMLYRDSNPDEFPFNKDLKVQRLIADEEALDHPSLKAESFDAVFSNMSMHWINDLPGVLSRISNILKPDGLFFGSMLGGDTLFELRTSLQLAELERKGGLSPRMSPLVDVNDIGGLLSKANFKLLTVDVENIVVSYPNLLALLSDIKMMGEGNAVISRASYLPKDVLLAAEPIYRAMHSEDGSLPATFKVIFMIGWKSSPTQPQPLERGSGQISMKTIFDEINDK